MIYIKPSPTADTRTCDVSTVSKNTLKESSIQHIDDVKKAASLFANQLKKRCENHDFDKISDLDTFYKDFQTKFEKHTWWDKHRKINRHHLSEKDGIPNDVDLLDVLEYISDCVMAGMARSGKVYDLKIDTDVLEKAFKNTVSLLKANVEIQPETKVKHF